jgi:hypothetical protein
MCNVTRQYYRLRYSCNVRARAVGAGLRYTLSYGNAKRACNAVCNAGLALKLSHFTRQGAILIPV